MRKEQVKDYIRWCTLLNGAQKKEAIPSGVVSFIVVSLNKLLTQPLELLPLEPQQRELRPLSCSRLVQDA